MKKKYLPEMDLSAYMAAGNCVNTRELRDRSELFSMKKLNKKISSLAYFL